MVLQHVYGRDPVIGYCDKKYSKSLETGEILTSQSVRLNKNIINSKINYVLPQYLYGDLPDCYYLIQKAGCAVFGKSSYIEAGRSEYINHNYIFTDPDRALDIFSGESIFDTNIFLTRIEQADDYDVENAVFAKNKFDVSIVAKTLERLYIDRALFEKIIFALIESIYLGTRVYIVPKNMNKIFTDDVLELIKCIFYVLPKVLLYKIGFITYFSTFSSIANTLDGRIRLVCIENTADNMLMIDDVLAGGNFIFQLDERGSAALYPDSVDTSGMDIMRLFSGAVFENTGVGYKDIFDKADIFPSNSCLLYIIYLGSQQKDSPDKVKDAISKILFLSKGFDDLFQKFEAVSKCFDYDLFIEVFYICVLKMLEKSHYSNLIDFANNVFFVLDSGTADTELSGILDKLLYFFVDRHLGSIDNVIEMDDAAAESILLWSNRLISYVGNNNNYKLSNINIYKKLKAAINNLSPDCVNIYLIANDSVRKKLSRDIEHLSLLYIKNKDDAKEEVFNFILPVLLEDYLEAFKLAWTKGGLHELIRFATQSEQNSLLHDLDSGILSSNEIDRSLRLFFKQEAAASVLEKSVKTDAKIKAFAKKHRLL